MSTHRPKPTTQPRPDPTPGPRPTNEAAERLRKMWGMGPVRVALLDDALAAERRATVERIRDRVREVHDDLYHDDVKREVAVQVLAILNEEAAR